jgi:hypothetical protein
VPSRIHPAVPDRRGRADAAPPKAPAPMSRQRPSGLRSPEPADRDGWLYLSGRHGAHVPSVDSRRLGRNSFLCFMPRVEHSTIPFQQSARPAPCQVQSVCRCGRRSCSRRRWPRCASHACLSHRCTIGGIFLFHADMAVTHRRGRPLRHGAVLGICLLVVVSAPRSVGGNFLRGTQAESRSHAAVLPAAEAVSKVDGYDDKDGTLTNICECGIFPDQLPSSI